MLTITSTQFKQPFLVSNMDYFLSKNEFWNGENNTDIVAFEQFKTTHSQHCFLEIFPDGTSAVCFEITPENEISACFFGRMTETKITFYENGNTYFAVKIPAHFLFKQINGRPNTFVDRVSRLATYTDAFNQFDWPYFAVASFEQRITYFQAYVSEHFIYHENDLINYVLANQQNNEKSPTIKQLSKELGVSDRYIRSIFHRLIGISPKKMTQEIRLQFALSQLMDETNSITDMLQQTNFYDHPHLNKFFSSFTAYSPKALKRQASLAKQVTSSHK
ncbi:helix-turn-helix domain-containing protein [Lactococcus piscium]|uniref:Helix-turn-helix domain-containing protein n=1 Tax=Pseudolactococcus piscium MKFS47 TaxID=297352 RepID=A0A0D6DUW0_9LACT|nr:helix-turn-helix domain-containing protein [Lactococcus piscium]CEN27717.1 Helix-turn-helix domain-containing protein [Lactococcus piscium MKFS47]